MGMPVEPIWEAEQYAFYNDGTESGSTIVGTVNTQQTLDTDTIYFCRISINDTAPGTDNADVPSLTVKWQFNNAGGGWTDVGTTTAVQFAASGNVTDGGTTSNRDPSNTGTFNAGRIYESAANATTVITANGSTQSTEVLLVFQIDSAQVSDNAEVLIRCTEGDGTLLAGTAVEADIDVNLGAVNYTKTLTPGGTGTASLSTQKTGAPTPPEPVEPDLTSYRYNQHRTPGGNCLFLGLTTPSAADLIVHGWFRDAGWRVENRILPATIPADVTDFDIVYISESVSSANVTAAWIECPVPLCLTESSGADNLELTDADSAASASSPTEFLRLVRQFGHKTFDAGADLDATYPTWVNRGWASDANLSPGHIKLMEVGAGGGETSAFLIPKGGETFGRPARHTRSVMWLDGNAINAAGPWMRRILVGLLEETAWHDVPRFREIYQSKVIVPDTGGANLKTLTPSATGTSALSRITARFRSYAHSGVGTATLTRVVDRFRSYAHSGTGTATLSRITARFRTFTFSGVGTAALTTLKGFARQAAMTATGTATLATLRAAFRTLSSSGVGTSALSTLKAASRTLASSGTGTAALSRVKSAFLTLASSGVGTATLATIKGRAQQAAMSGVGTASLVTIKAAFRSLASLATGSATLARLTARLRTFTFSGIGTSTLTTIKNAFRSFSASGVGTASLSTLKGKGVLSTFSGIGTATLAKVLGALRTLSSSATGTASLSRLFSAFRSFSAAGTGTTGFSRVFGAKRVLSSVATGTAALSAVLGGTPDYTQSASMTGVGTASLSTVYTPAPPVTDTRPDGAAGYHGDVQEPYQRVIEEEDIEAFIKAFLRSLE